MINESAPIWRDTAELTCESVSERNVAVLLGGVRIALGLQHAQSGNQFRPSELRLDDFINETQLSGDVRIGKLLTKFPRLFLPQTFAVRCCRNFLSVENVH